jgi:hypothetical protein
MGVDGADPPGDGEGAVALGVAAQAPSRNAATAEIAWRDRGIPLSIRRGGRPAVETSRPGEMERETRFELATSTLGRWRSAS